MTEQQKQWLADHPGYSVVRHSIVTVKGWDKQGYLYPNGRFTEDDGKTMFVGTENALRIGREFHLV